MRFHRLITSAVLTAAIAVPAVSHAEGEFVPILSFAAGLLNQGIFPTSDQYTTDDSISITAEDGVNIEGNIFVPTNLQAPAPAIVFISSWALNEYEYLQQAGELAEKGYIVLSYSTRGFGGIWRRDRHSGPEGYFRSEQGD